MADQEQGMSLPLVFTGGEQTPVLYANHFLVQQQQSDEHILTIGQVSVPPVIGEDEQAARAQLRLAGFVPITVHGRYIMSRQKLVELVGVLSRHLERPRLPGDAPRENET